MITKKMPVENMILSLFYLQSRRTALDNYKLKDFIHHLSEMKYLIFPNEIFQPEAVTAVNENTTKNVKGIKIKDDECENEEL